MLRVKFSTADPLIRIMYVSSVIMLSTTDMFPLTKLQTESKTDIKIPMFSLAKF